MSSPPVSWFRLASQGSSQGFGGAGSYTQLWGINVNKATASCTINVFAANPSTAASRIATIDGNVRGPNDFYGLRCAGGLNVVMLGGDGDCTVTYS